MIKQDHLEVYDLILTTKAPLFIGSGRKYTKKEYLYDKNKQTFAIMDEEKLLKLLRNEKLLDSYENFILFTNDYLHNFFVNNHINGSEIESITLFSGSAGDALTDKPLSEIQEFIRNKHNVPYCPGSSLKGALRTVLLTKLILQSPSPEYIDFRSKSRSKEAEYLNILTYNKKNREDEVNSLMRAISISDSEPIEGSSMILARKDDISVSGKVKTINTIRECIRPGVEIRFKLTLDKSQLGKIDIRFIKDAIGEYGKFYKEIYVRKFNVPNEAVKEDFQNCIIIGGGSGYFSKNIVYSLLGRERALKVVTEIMKKKFKDHKHENDILAGISPHRLKHTTYQRKSWHFGVCSVEIN